MAARCISRAPPPIFSLSTRLGISPTFPSYLLQGVLSRIETSSLFGNCKFNCKRSIFIHHVSGINRYGAVSMARRDYWKTRGRKLAAVKKSKERELELNVVICIEEQLPVDSEVKDIAELMRLDVPKAMKLVFQRLSSFEYKTRERIIKDVSSFESIELSVLLCNDEFIQKLNKEWRDEDHPTDVLSMSQHIPGINLPILMLGDVVISMETAARQADERGHALIDEMRILLVHGLLHLVGFDHELSGEAEKEMENEEEVLLTNLGWKGKGLILSAYEAGVNDIPEIDPSVAKEKELSTFYKPKFRYIFCDMDGTMLNSKSEISSANAKALKEATLRGVNVVIATGKARPAVMHIMKLSGLAGRDGIFSEFSPGVFVQGLLVYGRLGQEIFRKNLEVNVCKEALIYSLKHNIPVIAFSNGRCLTLFEHPLVDLLHTVYHEPKAEIIPSVEQLLTDAEIQKLIFLDTSERVASTLRPYWEAETEGHAGVVQAVPDMLEIVPLGTSKWKGVELLLDHLGVTREEVMAIGDGENDVEMLQLASLGVALSNGSEKAKAVADAIGVSNDEDGVADAIYRYAL